MFPSTLDPWKRNPMESHASMRSSISLTSDTVDTVDSQWSVSSDVHTHTGTCLSDIPTGHFRNTNKLTKPNITLIHSSIHQPEAMLKLTLGHFVIATVSSLTLQELYHLPFSWPMSSCCTWEYVQLLPLANYTSLRI